MTTSAAAVAERLGTSLEIEISHMLASRATSVAVIETPSDFIVQAELSEVLAPFMPIGETSIDSAAPAPLSVTVAERPLSKMWWTTMATTIALQGVDLFVRDMIPEYDGWMREDRFPSRHYTTAAALGCPLPRERRLILNVFLFIVMHMLLSDRLRFLCTLAH